MKSAFIRQSRTGRFRTAFANGYGRRVRHGHPGLAARQVEAIVDLVRQTFLLVSPLEAVAAVPDDPDDDTVLEAALAAAADIVVSGDDHLLRLGEFRGIRIVSPAALITEIRGEHDATTFSGQ